ncbi:WD40-repeat-containing domain protein [Chaetomidium leptoderma]|uniref:WD40-repeat-containing domain protein n=1 Tax=Chaetomidium leptoderma TaxID=669021 RepID=A0AAN6VPD4_9PEZI|nr:WD40-repeat-containing domain protein [Chaetomidium leptoderma]
MSGEAWLYLFAVVINAVNLFLQVFFTIMYSDLECDYINPIDLCNRLNTYIIPEVAVHGFMTFLFLINGYWLPLILNLPLLGWNIKKCDHALVVRQAQAPDHAVVPYTGDDLARPRLGPANPFRDESATTALTLAATASASSASSSSLKRKNVLTGHAQETFISEHTFRAKHRAVERAGAGGPQREGMMSNREQKEVHKRLREGREGRGDATVADGEGAYVGPWARYRREQYEVVEVEEGGALGSGEEYEVVEEGEEEEEEEVVTSGTLVQAPAPSLARRKEAEELGEETTTFLGGSEYDYLGRTYMHVPQDLDISLTKEPGSVTNFIPKKLVYTWRPHGKPVTALQLFPRSSHLGLSGAADGLVKIWDIYREGREVLRAFAGHNKAITDLSFNTDGTRFLSGGFDRRIRLWDTETGQCVNRFNCGKTPHVIKFNPSAENGHEFLAGLSDNRILQYDSRAGNETVQEYDHHLGAINTIEFIDENRRFMSTSDDRSLRVWEYGIPVEIKTISEPDMFALTKSAQHPSGKYVLYQCSDNSIVAYSSGSDKFRQHRKKAWRGHNTAGSAIGLTCSPDGQFVASGDTGGSVCFWDFKTCKMYSKITADSAGGSVNCLAWSEQETSKVFTAGAKGDIRMWD